MKIKQGLLVISLFWFLGDSFNALAGGTWIFLREGSYQGKVIDNDTRQPIEGAVVNAIYSKSCYRIVQYNTYEIGIQEAVTDHEGAFKIPGYWTFVSPDCSPAQTRLTVFKGGYGDFPNHHYSAIFAMIFPESGKEELVYEGEILEGWHRGMEDQLMEQKEKFYNSLDEEGRKPLAWLRRDYEEGRLTKNMVLMIQLPDAGNRLASLNIPFPGVDEFPNNAIILYPWDLRDLSIKYRVIGLRHLKTMKERRQIYGSPSSDRNLWKYQKHLIKALRDEWQYVTGSDPGDLYKIK